MHAGQPVKASSNAQAQTDRQLARPPSHQKDNEVILRQVKQNDMNLRAAKEAFYGSSDESRTPRQIPHDPAADVRIAMACSKAPPGSVIPPRMNEVRKPASNSLFETTLKTPRSWRLPTLEKVSEVQRCLKRDQASAFAKYKDGHLPAGPEARFNIVLPQSPGHQKYCSPRSETMGARVTHFDDPEHSLSEHHKWRYASKHHAANPNALRDAITVSEMREKGKVMWSVQKLETLFKMYAENNVISHRKFFVAVTQQKELKETFVSYETDEIAAGENRIIDSAKEHKKQMERVKAIMNELDEDASGLMEWDEFVEFFRRAGYLLEYRDETHNRTDMDAVLAEQKKKQQELEEAQGKSRGAVLESKATAEWSREFVENEVEATRKQVLLGDM